MGFRRNKQPYFLKWEPDSEYAGLEVRAKGVSIGKLMDIIRLQEKAASAEADASTDAIEKLFTEFSGALLEWNLEYDDGTPVPADLEGVRSQDLDLVLNVVMQWMAAQTSVPGPLDKPSSSGPSSEEALSLAAASRSLQS